MLRTKHRETWCYQRLRTHEAPTRDVRVCDKPGVPGEAGGQSNQIISGCPALFQSVEAKCCTHPTILRVAPMRSIFAYSARDLASTSAGSASAVAAGFAASLAPARNCNARAADVLHPLSMAGSRATVASRAATASSTAAMAGSKGSAAATVSSTAGRGPGPDSTCRFRASPIHYPVPACKCCPTCPRQHCSAGSPASASPGRASPARPRPCRASPDAGRCCLTAG